MDGIIPTSWLEQQSCDPAMTQLCTLQLKTAFKISYKVSVYWQLLELPHLLYQWMKTKPGVNRRDFLQVGLITIPAHGMSQTPKSDHSINRGLKA